MATAQKIKVSSETSFIQDALKSGRATLQKFSMKRLTRLDTSLQPRVVHLNMDHVKNLGDTLQVQLEIGQDLFPGVLFHDSSTDWVGLVDGWHRLKAYQLAGLNYFPAYVVEGTREDAVEYAAMANQHAILKREPEDIKKQIFMLMDMPRWSEKSEKEIARHVGVSAPTVHRHQAAFYRDRGISVPDHYLSPDGSFRLKRRSRGGCPRITSKKSGNRVSYVASINGKRTYLSSDLSLAKALLAEKMASMESKRSTLDATNIFGSWLATYGISLARPNFPNTVYPAIGRSAYGYGRVVITARLDKPGAIYTAIGRLYALRKILQKPDDRLVMVCVCYPEDGPAALVDVARELDVELLTPEELVASIKGEGEGAS